MKTVDARIAMLMKLVESPERWSEIASSLSAFDWDSEEELVLLRPEHLIHVLNAYLSGMLASADVEGWATAVEGRDDIGSAESASALVTDALHWMSNPVLEGDLTPADARRWIQKLSS